MRFWEAFFKATEDLHEQVIGSNNAQKAITPSDEWQDNTWENPFWRSHKPVEVKFFDGTIKRLPCPRCARQIHGMVSRWRKAPDEEGLTQPTQCALLPQV